MWALLQQVPWPVVAGLMVTQLIPYLSQLATKEPSWATGMTTFGLSAADSFLSTLAASKHGHFDWRSALIGSLIFAAFGFGHQALAIRHTKVQDWLVRHGRRRRVA